MIRFGVEVCLFLCFLWLHQGLVAACMIFTCVIGFYSLTRDRTWGIRSPES